MWAMTRDWARLGQALASTREQLGYTQEQVAERLDIAKSTLQFIEQGKPRKKVTPTIRAYARLVGWTDESAADVLTGGNPTMRGTKSESAEERPPVAPDVAHDLSLHARQALREGPLLYEDVITMETAGGEVRATVVVRGKPDATEEEMLAALEAWRERERSEGRLND